MADFLTSYQKTNKHEGGYANDPDDRGGETWKGVARKMHPSWNGWKIIDSYKGKPSFPAILNLLEDLEVEVKKFYRLNFWNQIKGDELLYQLVADSIYDSCVNMGVSAGIKLAQRSLGLEETGTMNNITLEALNNK